MLTSSDKRKLARLKKERPDIGEIIDKIELSQTMTLRKLGHELGNILTLVNSSLQLIEASHPEVKTFKYWDITITDVNYMKELVSELLYYNNSNKLNLGPVNISAIINGICQSFCLDQKYKNITFKTDAPLDIPVIMADYVKLKQAFINLVKNACEAVDEQGTINVALRYTKQEITLIVQDDGCGMSREQIKTIFTPMITYKENGTGLGLSITEKVITAHNGSIEVDSKQGIGTKFTIHLPI